MPSSIRLKRISDRIKEDLSELLLKGVQDPRLTGVQVTDVRVDRELAFADVFVSAVEGQARKKEVLSGLEHASGFLRSQLAANIELRTFPRLRFHWDPTPERADHIERLLASLRNEASSAPQAEEQADDETEDSAGNE
jgi:ribosome-binding factor A|uniref:Ribosome-binding factor A n=1 Tax=Anaerolinea thermolimosa TaxID=229919 RepID=A0A7C4KIM7_9CHLR